MPLESATYLDDLNPANPAATDLLSQGDDHIRLIKAVLQATFPNIAGPVTLSDTDINGLVTLISGGGVPTGTVAMWYGSSASVPSGWGICNGTTYPKSDLSGNIVSPDLRDRVAIGVGAFAVTQGTVYGASTATATTGAAGAHTHTISGTGGHAHSPTIAGHALSISEMPAHTHTVGFNDSGSTGTCPEDAVGSPVSNQTTSSTGGGAAHTHGISFSGTDGTHTHTMAPSADHTHGVTVATYQPALALHYIMKL
jgi:microcystin-dependent protein